MIVNGTHESIFEVKELLKKQNLPHQDIEKHITNFLLMKVENKLFGTIGMEIYNNHGLLRSLAVDNCYQNKGYAKLLVKELEKKASSTGVDTLYLLTTTAKVFFERLKYSIYDKNDTPLEIQQTAEFTFLCPSTAISMNKNLTKRFRIIALAKQHWDDVKLIYRGGISKGNATFQDTAQSLQWDNWINTHECSIVMVDNNENVIGWAAISPVSKRKVYQGVGEVSIYIRSNYQNQNLGKELLGALINKSEQEGFWTIQASIFPENEVSIKIHKSLGFREVGFREKIGKMTYGEMKGQWRDTILLERRSKLKTNYK